MSETADPALARADATLRPRTTWIRNPAGIFTGTEIDAGGGGVVAGATVAELAPACPSTGSERGGEERFRAGRGAARGAGSRGAAEAAQLQGQHDAAEADHETVQDAHPAGSEELRAEGTEADREQQP